MDYRDADDALFEAFEAEAQAFFGTIARTQYKNTYRALHGFIFKTNALKTGIFDAVESSNPYVLRILFRCLCEHYLKFTHIFLRFLEERTDQAGIDFFSYCGATEVLDYAKALKLAESLIGRDLSVDVEQLLTDHYPKVALLSGRELETRSAEFRYREILRRLSRNKQFVSANAPFLASIVPAYAELSSFVHGGPMADTAMVAFGSEDEELHCEQKAGLAFCMVGSIYSFNTMVVAGEFAEFMPLASKVKSILTQYMSASTAAAT